jgi:2-polyprenyl-6-methoxyphenol hydroxylase-like FAD-dependent oxidoreductase
VRHPDLLIIGGGPAGLMAGLLFARSGCRVRVVEKHEDFLHDFRGDTVHPSTMGVLRDIGLLDRFLERPHQRLWRAELRIAGEEMVVGDLSGVRGSTPFVAIMPQWDFLDFLRSEAERLPNFELQMGVAAERLLFSGTRISGVRLTSSEEVQCPLVLCCDGRRSLVREQDVLPIKDLGSPIDVFWFELPKRSDERGTLRIAVEAGQILVRVDRGHYWQCALVFPKRRAAEVRGRGIDQLVEQLEQLEPRLGRIGGDLVSMDQLHLLEVSLDRLRRWSRPGLLAIGDAAHAMSPMGGIGINIAIQDAVAAANLLAEPLSRGERVDHLLRKVQARRAFSAGVIQAVQKVAQNWVLAPILWRDRPMRRPPLPLRLAHSQPAIRRVIGRAIALGIRREKVLTREAA